MRKLLRLICLAALLGGCASLTGTAPVATAPPTPYSSAWASPRETPLWHTLMPEKNPAQNHSGFTFLETGPEAYRARLALIEAATATIDIQYYIWEFDTSGRAITEALIRAAGRGVRIRALIDGLRIDEKAEPLKTIARHPNMHVRIYNAFRTSFRSDFVRYTELVSDFTRLNQRMHNKVIAVDNTAAIIGGRNVSDDYFGLSPERYFHDRDVLAAGPATAEISATFDKFWNSIYAAPVGRFAGPADQSISAHTPWPDSPPAGPADVSLPRRLEGEALAAELAALRHALVWAPAQIVWSAPGPVFAEQAPAPEAKIETAFLRHLNDAQAGVTIQTPYLTLTRARDKALHAARRRHVAVTIHTNSLASTNWVIVQHGYLQERRKLLHWGVTLFEMKDRPAACCPTRALGVMPRKVILHPKTTVFDRRYVLVGSFNLDHRSVLHNSEVGVLIDSPELAARILTVIERDVQPENSWRLTMGPSNKLVWLDESQTPPRRYLDDPNTGFFEQFIAWFGYFLPIDSLL